MKKTSLVLILAVISILSCGKSTAPANPPPNNPDTTINTFAKGADIGWVTEMEANGYKFYNRQGKQEDCYQVMKDEGMNSIRIRAWVNPKDGWCNTADVVVKAKRAKAASM